MRRSLAMKNRQAGASFLAQGFSMETSVSLTTDIVTLHQVNLYRQSPKWRKLKRSLMDGFR